MLIRCLGVSMQCILILYFLYRSAPNFIFDVNSKDPMVFVDEEGLEAKCDVDKWCGVKTTGDVLKGKYMVCVYRACIQNICNPST